MPPAIPAASLSQTRTIEHYRLSLDNLQKSLPKSTQHYLNKTEFPAFRADQGVESNAVELQSAIEEMIQTRQEFTADPKRANKAKNTSV